MKFICAGLPKTGTKSLACALRILGFKVWDFDEQILYYMDDWLDFFQHGKPLDFYSMFKDVDAVVDYPCSLFFEELMQAFPEAKVILSDRDDEESWARSFKNQIEIAENTYETKFQIFLPSYKKLLDIILNCRMLAFGIHLPTCPQIYRKKYRLHNDRVKSVVPKEKLLVYRVQHGWKPLCEFTGKTIPEQPYPNLNNKGNIIYSYRTETELGRRVTREFQLATCCAVVLVGLIGTFLAVLYYNWNM